MSDTPANHTGENSKAAQDAAAKAEAARAELDARTTTVLDNMTARVTAKADTIADLYNRATIAQAGRGFQDTVAAAAEVGVTWTELAHFLPGRGENVSKGELAIRQLNDVCDPASSPRARAEFARLLRLAVHASNPNVVSEAKSRNKAVPGHETASVRAQPDNKEIASAQSALTALNAERADASYREDNKGAAFVQRFIDAVDNRDRLIRLAADLQNAQVASSKWRASLFLPYYADLISTAVEDTNVTVGTAWMPVCQAAYGAMKEFNAKEGLGKPDALKSAVDKAAIEKLESLVAAKSTARAAKPDAEIIGNAMAAIFYNIRKLEPLLQIPANEVDDAIRYLTSTLGLKDRVGEEKAAKLAEDEAEKALKDADKAAREKKREEEKAAKAKADAETKAAAGAATKAAADATAGTAEEPGPVAFKRKGREKKAYAAVPTPEPAPVVETATPNADGPSAADIAAMLEETDTE